MGMRKAYKTLSNGKSVAVAQIKLPAGAGLCVAKCDVEHAIKALDSVKSMVIDMQKEYAALEHTLETVRSEKWKDAELQNLKRERDQAVEDMYRGFPISQDESDKINAWIKAHDTEVHNNPQQYHGASGGGYEYVFFPTGLGTVAYCICGSCKRRSLQERGEKWFERCEELKGVFKFQSI